MNQDKRRSIPANLLDFERPVIELEQKIESLHQIGNAEKIDIEKEIGDLREKSQKQIKQIYAKLTPWQIVQVARYPQRPHTLDYIHALFTSFVELHGDRVYMDDAAIVAGIGYFDKQPVVIIGHQKGLTLDEKVKRNFGMTSPEGVRKATRMCLLAEKFSIPVITFVDTPGAYPGVGAEERNQSGAIAKALQVFAKARIPIISVIIGEGGSGGALAISICDRLIMLQYSYYSIISPEGCASILFKNADRGQDAAKSLCITSSDLLRLKIADAIVSEEIGGAHRNFDNVAERIASELRKQFSNLQSILNSELPLKRLEKLSRIGTFTE